MDAIDDEGNGWIRSNLNFLLTHGHGDGAYAQYSTSLWREDSIFSISSLCCVLHALEKPPVRESKDLFPTPQNDFFAALLHKNSTCTSSIPISTTNPTPILHVRRLAIPLLRKLYL